MTKTYEFRFPIILVVVVELLSSMRASSTLSNQVSTHSLVSQKEKLKRTQNVEMVGYNYKYKFGWTAFSLR